MKNTNTARREKLQHMRQYRKTLRRRDMLKNYKRMNEIKQNPIRKIYSEINVTNTPRSALSPRFGYHRL